MTKILTEGFGYKEIIDEAKKLYPGFCEGHALIEFHELQSLIIKNSSTPEFVVKAKKKRRIASQLIYIEFLRIN